MTGVNAGVFGRVFGSDSTVWCCGVKRKLVMSSLEGLEMA